MTLLTTSVVLALAWFAAISVLMSAAVWMAARVIHARGIQLGPGWLLLLRLTPAGAALVFIGTVFLPAHWLLESPGTPESFGVVVLTLVTLAAALATRTAGRAALVALHSAWLRRSLRGRPIASGDVQLAADALEVDDLNGLSLAGILSTRVLVGATARRVLTAQELDVALAHERAHRRAWDNLKRFAVFCAPDVLGLSAGGRQLEQSWNAAAECLADARAVAGDAARAVNLASALVKVARLVEISPPRAAVAAWSTFHQQGLLETRVRRLLAGAPTPGAVRLPIASLAGASVMTMLAASWLSAVPHGVYWLTEALIRVLP